MNGAAKTAGSAKQALECLECGKKFTKTITKTFMPECPKCGSSDIDLA